jgi:Na+-driven multidrug efflux pump
MIDFHWPVFAEMAGQWRVILHVGLPSALTNLATPVAMAVVIFIVSGLGEAAVAGFGVAIRIEAFALIVPHALSVIIGPFVGQNYGAGRSDRIRLAMRQALAFSVAYCLLVALLLGVFADWIGARFQDHPEVIDATAIYLIIVPVTFGFFAIIRIVAGAFNALGQPWPNVIFFAVKLLLIYVPLSYLGAIYMGYQGVAIASALSNILAGGLAYYWYRRHLPALLRSAP